jgi:hypothetical protein
MLARLGFAQNLDSLFFAQSLLCPNSPPILIPRFSTQVIMTHSHNNAPDWDNPHVIQINREPARSTFVPFADATQVLPGEHETSPYFMSLGGG